MEYSFYLDGANWIINGNITTPRTLRMVFDQNDTTVVSLQGLNNNYEPIPFVPITSISKDAISTKYTDKGDLISGTKDFFV